MLGILDFLTRFLSNHLSDINMGTTPFYQMLFPKKLQRSIFNIPVGGIKSVRT